MTTAHLQTFYGATAGVAGALIGLLFVAVSVAPERLHDEEQDQAHRVRAASALSAFTNALAVSLFALIPEVGTGGAAFALALVGLLFLASALISMLRVRREQERTIARREARFLAGQLVIFALQLVFAARLLAHDTAAHQTSLAIIVVVCCLFGIARSWELIGGPRITLVHELGALWGSGGDESPRE
jgi:hypothetical protein